MSKNAYVGVSGVARRVDGMCIGVANIARKVVAGYVGVNDIARQFYPQASSPSPDPEPVYPSNTSISIAASKCIYQTYTTLNQSNMDICHVGRAEYNYDGVAEESRAGAAIQFLAPAAGWDYYSSAKLFVYRNGGSASAPVIVGKLSGAYSDVIKWVNFFYGNYNLSSLSTNFSGGNGWKSIDISGFLPTGSGELGITLISKYSYITIDGNPFSQTAPYIQLSR